MKPMGEEGRCTGVRAWSAPVRKGPVERLAGKAGLQGDLGETLGFLEGREEAMERLCPASDCSRVIAHTRLLC